jgi:CelD/BcsL family acetyltransferase involved in cellulose biosynthesis
MLYEIDPLADPRWSGLLERHPEASVFHRSAWLAALRDTYAYRPIAFTDAPPGEPLSSALLFCQVDSWLTGRRLVSLPFSDHCAPLLESDAHLETTLGGLGSRLRAEGWRYIELRVPETTRVPAGYSPSESFCFHEIDLQPECDTIFGRFHKNHVQRTIRKAERSPLGVETGRSETLLAEFYGLHRLTRQRHGTPTQPLSWFANLLRHFGDDATIYMARVEGKPAATILTLAFKHMLVYKYGASDPAFNRYGGTSLLFWRAIQDAKGDGRLRFDLGRSDLDNPGLIAFKDHLGARRSSLGNYRFTGRALRPGQPGWLQRWGKSLYATVPRHISDRVGSALYRHLG